MSAIFTEVVRNPCIQYLQAEYWHPQIDFVLTTRSYKAIISKLRRYVAQTISRLLPSLVPGGSELVPPSWVKLPAAAGSTPHTPPISSIPTMQQESNWVTCAVA